LTVGELFGKQLLQIPGVAAEKVVGILEHYSTLREYVEYCSLQDITYYLQCFFFLKISVSFFSRLGILQKLDNIRNFSPVF
jgi:hypothetical protein